MNKIFKVRGWYFAAPWQIIESLGTIAFVDPFPLTHQERRFRIVVIGGIPAVCNVPSSTAFPDFIRWFSHRCWIPMVLLGLVVGGTFAPAWSIAQDRTAATITSQKPVINELIDRGRNGITYVSSEAGMERIERGDEPRTIAELHALEKQQEKVAGRIHAVTVNVQQGSAQGSGVIITPDGYVLTAAHVAGKPGREAKILLSDGRAVKARTLGTNRTMDAGLLLITDKNGSDATWPHATLGRSSELRLGQWVVAAGHPGGWMPDRHSVIRVGRVLNILNSTIVTDCALIGGDSGGPLFDMNGRLVGIHSRIGTETADNMHVPIDVYSHDWYRLAAGEAWGTLPGFKPIIGVELQSEADPNGPAIIGKVVPNSPAARIRIQSGDVIVGFDGTTIKSFNELQRAVQDSLPGDRVEIIFQRDGETRRKSIIIGLEDP